MNSDWFGRKPGFPATSKTGWSFVGFGRQQHVKNPEGKTYRLALPKGGNYELTPDIQGILPEIKDTALAPTDSLKAP